MDVRPEERPSVWASDRIIWDETLMRPGGNWAIATASSDSRLNVYGHDFNRKF